VSARDWAHALQAAVCDVVEPWAHGTVLRATRCPRYWDFNLVRVEEDPGMGAGELASLADEALAGLDHRRIDVEPLDVAEPLRAEFAAMGWLSERLVWMRHEEPPPPATAHIALEEVSWDEVRDLRVAWHREDFPEAELGAHLDEAREVARMLDARILGVREGSEVVAYAQLERLGAAAEITQVYVRADRRGRGLGTALTRAAIGAAGAVDDLWIVADDEGRPKEMYARLGFRPAWRAVHLLRLPPGR
jgi:ribosomal protein S18 acetylase RimI-like enzyme